eukprot:GHVO01066133.1.p2 GENE.GHVO01066133.1~~GHVO01066133.1.p2  ORF type:complete len:223 (+),score=40.15 GHVO01066133.1:1080-1748(+)
MFVDWIKANVPSLAGVNHSAHSTFPLPWCSDPLGDESFVIRGQLLKLNSLGLCTINSQPSVNGVPSSDPIFGWGPKGGYVYQKSYVEFFCSAHTAEALRAHFDTRESWTYMDTNARGEASSNCRDSVNALTWGVFPNAEIKQPTVVDFDSFLSWKDEAFMLWKSEWQTAHPIGSPSWNVIQHIYDHWHLVNVVDNNYITGELFTDLINAVSNFQMCKSPIKL